MERNYIFSLGKQLHSMNHTTSSSLVSHHNSIPSNEWALQREWSPACNRHQDPVQWPIVEPSPRERKQILLWLRIVLLMILILRCNIYRLRNKHETQNKQIKTYPGKKSLSKLYKCPSHRKAFLSGKRSSFASTWRSGGEFVRWRVCQVESLSGGRSKEGATKKTPWWIRQYCSAKQLTKWSASK